MNIEHLELTTHKQNREDKKNNPRPDKTKVRLIIEQKKERVAVYRYIDLLYFQLTVYRYIILERVATVQKITANKESPPQIFYSIRHQIMNLKPLS
ncbi:MAG: hypothetical protein WCA84_13495 [Ignavibacteriaceae bacterium]